MTQDLMGEASGGGAARVRAALDGLRGLAALNVVLAHFVLAFLPYLLKGSYPDLVIERMPLGEWVEGLGSPPLTLFFNGHFAVMVFFVLSGYVMTQPAFEGRPEALSRRLVGRYLRLNGPIFVAIWLSFLVGLADGYQNELAGARWGSPFFERHFTRLPSLSETLKISLWGALTGQDLRLDPPLWSLRIEWYGSMALLLIYRLFPRPSSLWTILAGGTLVALVPKADQLFSLFLWLGALLPRAPLQPRCPSLLVPLCALGGLFFGAYTPTLDVYRALPDLGGWLEHESERKTLYNGIGAILLVLSVLWGWASKALTSGLCRWLGGVSYALYLLHFPLLASLVAGLSLKVPETPAGLLWLLFSYLSLSLVLSAVFARLIDRPMIRCGQWLGQRLLP